MPQPTAALDSSTKRPVRSRAAAAARDSQTKQHRAGAGLQKHGKAAPTTDDGPSTSSFINPRPPHLQPGARKRSPASSVSGAGSRAASEATAKPLPTGVPESQRALVHALEDELAVVTSHPLLPATNVEAAKLIFTEYVYDQWRRGLGLQSVALLPEAVETVLLDLGIPATSGDVRELLFNLVQAPEVVAQNARIARGGTTGTPGMGMDTSGISAAEQGPAGAGGAAVATSVSAAPSASPTNRPHAVQDTSATVSVSFRVFLDLLHMTLGDCQYRTETALLWQHLDVDGDGEVSLADISTAMAEESFPVTGAPPSHRETLLLNETQLRQLLTDLDTDGDGVVSRADFIAATNSN